MYSFCFTLNVLLLYTAYFAVHAFYLLPAQHWSFSLHTNVCTQAIIKCSMVHLLCQWNIGIYHPHACAMELNDRKSIWPSTDYLHGHQFGYQQITYMDINILPARQRKAVIFRKLYILQPIYFTSYIFCESMTKFDFMELFLRKLYKEEGGQVAYIVALTPP